MENNNMKQYMTNRVLVEKFILPILNEEIHKNICTYTTFDIDCDNRFHVKIKDDCIPLYTKLRYFDGLLQAEELMQGIEKCLKNIGISKDYYCYSQNFNIFILYLDIENLKKYWKLNEKIKM